MRGPGPCRWLRFQVAMRSSISVASVLAWNPKPWAPNCPRGLVEFAGGEVGDAVVSHQGGAGDAVLWVDHVADSVGSTLSRPWPGLAGQPEVQRVERHARRGGDRRPGDILLVYRVDRMSRSLRGLVDILDLLDDAGD